VKALTSLEMWDIPSNFDITISGKETANKPMTSNSFLTLFKNYLTISRNTIFQSLSITRSKVVEKTLLSSLWSGGTEINNA